MGEVSKVKTREDVTEIQAAKKDIVALKSQRIQAIKTGEERLANQLQLNIDKTRRTIREKFDVIIDI